MRKEKICVYTAITGNYDCLREIEKENGIDYYCFTNNNKTQSQSWNVIYLDSNDNLSNVQLARKIKILGHPLINDKYDIALWMDGAVSFNKKIHDFIHEYLGSEDNFVAFRHGERKTIKEEAISCIRYKKETKETVKKLLDFYQKENYHFDNGLIESTVFIKRPQNKCVIDTMHLWFDMVLNYSKRDQLSFNYCIQKTGLKVRWIDEKVFDNPWFSWNGHNQETKILRYRVYFGDEEDYQIENDIQGDYKVKDNTYQFKIKIPKNTNQTIIEITNVPCVFYENLSIKGCMETEYIIYNHISYQGKELFYNKDAVLLLSKELKANDFLEFKVDLFPLQESEKNSLIESFSVEKVKLENQMNELETELKMMKNSMSWTLTKPLRYLRKLFKGKKV